jgi:hypothetical protein
MKMLVVLLIVFLICIVIGTLMPCNEQLDKLAQDIVDSVTPK